VTKVFFVGVCSSKAAAAHEVARRGSRNGDRVPQLRYAGAQGNLGCCGALKKFITFSRISRSLYDDLAIG